MPAHLSPREEKKLETENYFTIISGKQAAGKEMCVYLGIYVDHSSQARYTNIDEFNPASPSLFAEDMSTYKVVGVPSD